MPDLPLVSFVLLAYKQEQFVAEAVQAAFDQTYSPLEIILSDDCSPDGTFQIMEEMVRAYTGPHTIVLNRNSKNLGIGGHVNRLMELAQGKWVVVAAGDDISLPERTSVLMEKVRASNEAVQAIFSQVTVLSDDERNNEPYHTVEYNNLSVESIVCRELGVTGNAAAWKKELFRIFQPMHPIIVREDLVLSFRAALVGKILYVPRVLVRARLGGVSHSGASLHYHRHALNAYGQMLIDLATYLGNSPQELPRVRHLASLIQRYYDFQLIRIGRQFIPTSLSLQDHIYAFGEKTMRKRAISHIMKRLRKLLFRFGFR